MRVLLASSEVAPFAKTGGLADVSSTLPRTLKRMGHDAAVVMPMYRGIHSDAPPIASLEVPFAWGRRWCGVYRKEVGDDVPVYLIDYKEFFDREGYYGNSHGDYGDNAARFAYFSRAVCELALRVLPEFDVIHANDWQCALIPVFLRTHYAQQPKFLDTGAVLTVHNMGYQGVFRKEWIEVLELGWEYFTQDCLEHHDSLNFLKGGIVFADLINTVSRRYAYEIQTPDYGHGLDGTLRRRSHDLWGILNGVDYTEWDPATDRHIPAHYGPDDLQGKRDCKRDLLGRMGLDANYAGPVIGVVSRLADQKGFDLIAAIAYRLMEFDCLLVVLGSGDSRYEHLFRSLAAAYPRKVGVYLGYNNDLAHRIEAGADLFLMPSKYEPCGLNQIYSLKYGTIPVVRATGGLDDTIEDFNFGEDSGTGFKFYHYHGEDLLYAVARALAMYGDRGRWTRMMRRAMSRDFSWDRSARLYEEYYRQAVAKHRQFIHR